MKILLFGNIGSGKTTISNNIVRLIPDCEYLAIDDFRREIGDGTMKGDSKAKSAFVKSISHDINLQLIECTGLGRLGSSVFRRLKKYQGDLIVVVLSTSLELCLGRIAKREWDIPFPEDIMKGEELVRKLNKLYHSSFLFERWGLRENTSFFYLPNRDDIDARIIEGVIVEHIKKNKPS